jgi:hypothetical protein
MMLMVAVSSDVADLGESGYSDLVLVETVAIIEQIDSQRYYFQYRRESQPDKLRADKRLTNVRQKVLKVITLITTTDGRRPDGVLIER